MFYLPVVLEMDYEYVDPEDRCPVEFPIFPTLEIAIVPYQVIRMCEQ